ncbi:MAG: 4'-phosphopantetheinyl transferase superfamily protein [Candidatus Hydrogenedentota bacterium]
MPQNWSSTNDSAFIPPDSGSVHLYRFELDASPSLVSNLETLLATEEHTRAHRFLRDIHRIRFTLARGALRCLLGRILDASPDSIEFTYGDQGKPALDAKFDGHDISFNVSHSDNFAVIAITRTQAIGIDIEMFKYERELEKLAKHYFSPNEVDSLLSLPEMKQEAGFYRCWSSKEALMKVSGLGLSLGLNTFDVEVNPDKPPALLKPPHKISPCPPYSWSEFSIAPKVSGIFAIDGPLTNVEYINLNLESMLD